MTIELRQDGDKAEVDGTASKYGVPYSVGGVYTERVLPGAATQTLRSEPDVLFTANHDRARALARTPNTLRLWEDSVGLHYRATVDLNDSDARAVVSKIESGVLRESSFAFRMPKGGDEWNDDFTERTIKRFDLHRGDVSAVVFGASPTTTVSVTRAAEAIQERRALADAVSRTGWCGPVVNLAELRKKRPALAANDSNSLVDQLMLLVARYGGVRDDVTITIDDDDDEPCENCDGKGWVGDQNHICPVCGGSGIEPDDDDDDAPDEENGQRSRIAPNDGYVLRAQLSTISPVRGKQRSEAEWEAMERRFLAERRVERERVPLPSEADYLLTAYRSLLP